MILPDIPGDLMTMEVAYLTMEDIMEQVAGMKELSVAQTVLPSLESVSGGR